MRQETSYSLHLYFLSPWDSLNIHTSDLCPSQGRDPKQCPDKAPLHSHTVSVLFFAMQSLISLSTIVFQVKSHKKISIQQWTSFLYAYLFLLLSGEKTIKRTCFFQTIIPVAERQHIHLLGCVLFLSDGYRTLMSFIQPIWTLHQAWAIISSKGPHEKLGLLWIGT